ncbi:MAG: class SAM-dependent methyltransferase [Fibrobacteria bacterium]|jgi:cyclopropane-fatty-acyl-phospholipid synthase|nr:class SAM-dependent methyltransferase [Fibrobacteria bacterium]
MKAFSAFARGAQAWTLKSMSRLFPEKVVRSVMSNIRIGCIEVETPDSGRWTLGDPAAALRCHVRIHRKEFFENLVRYWDVGLGESYQEGDFEVDDLVAFLRIIILNIPHLPGISGSEGSHPDLNREQEDNLRLHRSRGNTLRGSKANISYHYDLSNALYQIFLDPSMAYSSAVYRTPADTLHEAQVHKFDLLCRKLELKAGEHVLEIGSGWGGFAIHAAREYGCRVTTLTLSQEQKTLAEERIRAAGQQDRVEVRLQDYREVTGRYDKIVSIEMFEAVGYEYFDVFFAKCREVLKPEGLMAMQVITMPDARFEAYKDGCDWIQKHIFPGCLLPSVYELSRSVRNSGGLTIQHLENFDLHYARTLWEWRKTFRARRAEVLALGFDMRFFRTWDYYLAYCEAAFSTRNIGLLQLTLAFPNNVAYRGANYLAG